MIAANKRAACDACGQMLDSSCAADESTLHNSCRLRYPDALLKAISDPFDYALRLRTGELFYFSTAKINGDFVYLEIHDIHDDKRHGRGERQPCCLFARGVDVRASDIVWCADAPWDS